MEDKGGSHAVDCVSRLLSPPAVRSMSSACDFSTDRKEGGVAVEGFSNGVVTELIKASLLLKSWCAFLLCSCHPYKSRITGAENKILLLAVLCSEVFFLSRFFLSPGLL